MTQTLIIIRGNSVSGKTTIAKKLQRELGEKTMLIQQDVVRREVLNVRDTSGSPAMKLIENLALYGKFIDYNVIVEGILSKRKYGEMLQRVIAQFDRVFVYYFDIPFEETLRRHKTKPNAHEFGEKELRDWWKEKDMLGVDDRIITAEMNEQEIVDRMMNDYMIG